MFPDLLLAVFLDLFASTFVFTCLRSIERAGLVNNFHLFLD